MQKRRCTMIAIGPFQPDKTVGTPLVYIYIYIYIPLLDKLPRIPNSKVAYNPVDSTLYASFPT